MRGKIALMWSMARWPTATPAPLPEWRRIPPTLLNTSATAPVVPLLAGKAIRCNHAPRLLQHPQEHQPAHQVTARSITLPALVHRVRQLRPGSTTSPLTPGPPVHQYRNPRG